MKNKTQEPGNKKPIDQDQATRDQDPSICKSKDCTNNLYKWTSDRDPRYCADCV